MVRYFTTTCIECGGDNKRGLKAQYCSRKCNLKAYNRKKKEKHAAWVKADPELKWPDGMSASADHIIPLAKGGSHTEDNLQLAHLTCNMIKGDRLIRVGG